MPDENGANGTPEGTPAQNGQGLDFERQYNELRPEFTRATQRLSEYEQLFAALHDPDPEIQAQAADYLGLEFAGETGAPQTPADNDDDDLVDPLEQTVTELRAQVDELKERSELEATAKQEQETIELRDEYIGDAISYIEEQAQTKFSEKEEEVLGNLAIAMADSDDVPDVQGAYQRLYGDDGIIESRFQQRIGTKTGAARPPMGVSIPADKKPKTAEERVAYVDERWRELDSQQ